MWYFSFLHFPGVTPSLKLLIVKPYESQINVSYKKKQFRFFDIEKPVKYDCCSGTSNRKEPNTNTNTDININENINKKLAFAILDATLV